MNAASFGQSPQPLAVTLAMGSYTLWGILPIYWKLLDSLPAPVIFCHRILWSAGFSFALLLCMRRLGEVRAILSRPALLGRLAVSGTLVGMNWLLYIWAVNSGRILESSLGYFIMPLFSVLLGVLIFRDRPRPLQICGIFCAVAGVAVQLAAHGRAPLVAIGLAASFALYGVVRKSTHAEALSGLLVETAILTPLTLLYLVLTAQSRPDAFFAAAPDIKALLIGAGIVTAIPLLGFAYAARRVSLITLGLLQYISPSIAFCIGAFVYKEPLDYSMLITFVCIWSGLFVYTLESRRVIRLRGRVSKAPPKSAVNDPAA